MDLGQFASNLVQYILAGLQNVVAWLITLAVSLMSWLPDHVPVSWPDPASWATAFRGIGLLSRFVDLPLMFSVFGLLLTWHLGVLLYGVYRVCSSTEKPARAIAENPASLAWGGPAGPPRRV